MSLSLAMIGYLSENKTDSYLQHSHDSYVPVHCSVECSHHVEEAVIKEAGEEPLVDQS